VELLNEHFGEIIAGLVLVVFGWGFTSWSTTLSNSTTDIISKFTGFINDYHKHKLESERRLTRMETQVQDLARRLEKVNGERR